MESKSTPSFSDRIQERWRSWWGRDQSFGRRLHRFRELNTHHHTDDADDSWRCCPLWRRTLANKINGKAFARRHGARVNETYWHGRQTLAVPWNQIPEQFVLKPVWGKNGNGVYVVSEGREHIRDIPMTRSEIVRKVRSGPPVSWVPLMIEEHAQRPDGTSGEALEFKFHVFRDRLEAITSESRRTETISFYTADWEPFPDSYENEWPHQAIDPPACLDEMIEIAVRLGVAYGSYVRVDLFWIDTGYCFNEFASTPDEGLGLTEFANEYLGDCWARMLERSREDFSASARF